MQVWPVQDTGNDMGKAGAVSSSFHAEYPGEAEVILLGFAPGKAYDSVGIGRHGNFMQWGWSAPPSKMTEAGRRLFANCVSYMAGFSGKPFLRIPQVSSPRQNITSLFGYMADDPSRAASYRPRFFPPDVLEKFPDDLEALREHYRKNVELIRVEGNKYHIDDRFAPLGLTSNRSVSELGKLIDMLAEPGKAKAARELLLHYTQESFTAPAEWKAWYEANQDRLFFSDRGGYKFYLRPLAAKGGSGR